MFTPFIFEGESLGQDDNATENIDYWTDNLSPKQRLRFVLKKLLDCDVRSTKMVLAKNKVSIHPHIHSDQES